MVFPAALLTPAVPPLGSMFTPGVMFNAPSDLPILISPAEAGTGFGLDFLLLVLLTSLELALVVLKLLIFRKKNLSNVSDSKFILILRSSTS